MMAHLSRWLTIAPTASGLLRGHFDREWAPLPSRGTDLTTQGRLIYVMAVGYEMSGDRRYLNAAVRGTDFLLDQFHDSVHGGFFEAVDVDGTVINPSKRTYGHAFALLALSEMARVTKQTRYRTAALNAWGDIELHLKDADGGFRPEAPSDFAPTHTLRNQNPLMHMFEALMALVEATGDAQVEDAAVSVGNFVMYKLLQGQPDGGAYIPEWYDEHWNPLPTKEKGGYIDLGHQFEWSHLLVTASHLGLSPLCAPVAERLLKYALKAGYDDAHGGVFFRAYPDGSIDRTKYYWEQVEGLRTLMVAASNAGGNGLWHRYDQTLTLIKAKFVDDVHGGWWLNEGHRCSAKDCDESQPEPYHMVGMDRRALELATPVH